jgi:hypothetical protein
MKQKTLLWATMLIGPLILASYWRGVNAVDDPLVYWGDVPESMQSFIVPWMFVAAAGYLLMWHRFFFAWSEADVASLHWPWSSDDGRGVHRLAGLYAAFLIASLLWIDLTRSYIESPSALGAFVVIAVLWVAGLASLGFGVLVWSSRDRLVGARWALVGCVMLSIQCTGWDAVYWVASFGW